MTNKKVVVYLSLGSNIEDRMAHLSAAEEKLGNHPQIKIIKKSNVYETEPWPRETGEDHPEKEKGQMWFLNQVIQTETNLGPQELLNFIESIESDIGRSQKHHWGSREIDIDILLYGNDVIELDNLTIPHRHMNDRQFILVPLTELDPRLKDPVSGKFYKNILTDIKDDHKVTPFF